MSTARHPQTDGQSERANRVVEEMIRHYINPSLTDWVDHLPMLEFAYNSSVQASTAASPFYLNYGHHPLSVLDVAYPVHLSSISDSAECMLDNIRTAVTNAQHHIQKSQDRQTRYANKLRRDVQYSVGDLVLLSSDGLKLPSASDQAKKFQAKFYGPYKVLEVMSDLTYKLDLPRHMRIHPVFHVSKLKLFHDDPRHPDKPEPVLVSGQPEYFVRSILKHRPAHLPRHQAKSYLVEWEGYPLEDATWERKSSVSKCAALQKYLDSAPGSASRRQSRKVTKHS